MKLFLLVLFVIPSIIKCNDVKFVPLAVNNDWWQTASFYQIYPRSFKDSDGDGIGDLNGVTEKLQYLKDIGINATWLSPIFKSPMADFGYDIADFYNIQPEYGTMKDFDNMIKKAKEIGIKIILDFVPNHSSDENQWFINSENKVPGWEDFYVWHPGYPNKDKQNEHLPPSNWISFFFGSAWQWSQKRQEFYLHQFHRKQPDLNYRNPKVVDEMKSVLRFWLDKGVDGFRIDAVPTVFEVEPDSNGRYPDEPKTGNTDNPNDPGYLRHIYTQDRDETLDMVYQWRAVMDKYQKDNGGGTRIMMTESYSPIDVVMKYYGDGKRLGSHIPFNFLMITSLHNNSNANDLKNVVDTWLTNMPVGKTANWVMGNHDQNRVSSRFGEDRIDLLNMIIQTLPGASVTYNGEELGMTDVWISWNDTVDPAACNTDPTVYEKFSRDPERTPFQWDDTTSAGFSTNPKTWLPVASDYKQVNVKVENSADQSHLKVYKDLMRLRQADSMREGVTVTIALTDNVFVIVRSLPGNSMYITVANLSRESQNVDLTAIENLPRTLTYYVVGSTSRHKKGGAVNKKHIELMPSEAFILTDTSTNSYYSYEVFEDVKQVFIQ